MLKILLGSMVKSKGLLLAAQEDLGNALHVIGQKCITEMCCSYVVFEFLLLAGVRAANCPSPCWANWWDFGAVV